MDEVFVGDVTIAGAARIAALLSEAPSGPSEECCTERAAKLEAKTAAEKRRALVQFGAQIKMMNLNDPFDFSQTQLNEMLARVRVGWVDPSPAAPPRPLVDAVLTLLGQPLSARTWPKVGPRNLDELFLSALRDDRPSGPGHADDATTMRAVIRQARMRIRGLERDIHELQRQRDELAALLDPTQYAK